MASATDEVMRLLRLCIRHELVGTGLAIVQTPQQLAADYNGVGPESFPVWARHVLDRICALFLPAVFLHDVKFAHSDGSVEQFVAANDDLYRNCLTLIDHTIARWRIVTRWWRRRQARLIYEVCKNFGWTAYVSAYLKQQNKNNKE